MNSKNKKISTKLFCVIYSCILKTQMEEEWKIVRLLILFIYIISHISEINT